MSASDFAIDVRGVTKKFGDRTVVNDIAMQVLPGQPVDVKLNVK